MADSIYLTLYIFILKALGNETVKLKEFGIVVKEFVLLASKCY